eukprot:619973-Rhodomonas_salina.6
MHIQDVAKQTKKSTGHLVGQYGHSTLDRLDRAPRASTPHLPTAIYPACSRIAHVSTGHRVGRHLHALCQYRTSRSMRVGGYLEAPPHYLPGPLDLVAASPILVPEHA